MTEQPKRPTIDDLREAQRSVLRAARGYGDDVTDQRRDDLQNAALSYTRTFWEVVTDVPDA